MHTVISAVCNAALIALFAVAFGATFGRVHPLIDLAGQFVLPALIGAAALALLALITARYGTALFAVAALLANLLIAWPWLQSPERTEAAGPRFKVLLFNVYYRNPHLDVVAKLARDTNADIVVLLEILPRVRTHLDDVVAAYPNRVECWQESDCDALMLSRFPLQDIRASLPAPKNRRPMGAARVTIGDRTLTLFAAHLTLPPPIRPNGGQMEETQEVAEAVNGTTGPRLLVGDFNAVTWGAVVTRIRTFAALQVLTGPSATWPTFLPRDLGVPIDHMLSSDELVFLSRELITVPGSDHRAVLAEIAFRK